MADNFVRDLLQRLSFEALQQLFQENDINRDVLLDMSEADLESLGVKSFGQRKRMCKAIEDERARLTPTQSVASTSAKSAITTIDVVSPLLNAGEPVLIGPMTTTANRSDAGALSPLPAPKQESLEPAHPSCSTSSRVPATNTVFVGNLPPGVTEAEIRTRFKFFGEIHSVHVDGNRPKSYAFINYHDESSALTAVQQMSGMEFMGRRIELNRKVDHTPSLAPPPKQPSGVFSSSTLPFNHVVLSKQAISFLLERRKDVLNNMAAAQGLKLSGLMQHSDRLIIDGREPEVKAMAELVHEQLAGFQSEHVDLTLPSALMPLFEEKRVAFAYDVVLHLSPVKEQLRTPFNGGKRTPASPAEPHSSCRVTIHGTDREAIETVRNQLLCWMKPKNEHLALPSDVLDDLLSSKNGKKLDLDSISHECQVLISRTKEGLLIRGLCAEDVAKAVDAIDSAFQGTPASEGIPIPPAVYDYLSKTGGLLRIKKLLPLSPEVKINLNSKKSMAVVHGLAEERAGACNAIREIIAEVVVQNVPNKYPVLRDASRLVQQALRRRFADQTDSDPTEEREESVNEDEEEEDDEESQGGPSSSRNSSKPQALVFFDKQSALVSVCGVDKAIVASAAQYLAQLRPDKLRIPMERDWSAILRRNSPAVKRIESVNEVAIYINDKKGQTHITGLDKEQTAKAKAALVSLIEEKLICTELLSMAKTRLQFLRFKRWDHLEELSKQYKVQIEVELPSTSSPAHNRRGPTTPERKRSFVASDGKNSKRPKSAVRLHGPKGNIQRVKDAIAALLVDFASKNHDFQASSQMLGVLYFRAICSLAKRIGNAEDVYVIYKPLPQSQPGVRVIVVGVSEELVDRVLRQDIAQELAQIVEDRWTRPVPELKKLRQEMLSSNAKTPIKQFKEDYKVEMYFEDNCVAFAGKTANIANAKQALEANLQGKATTSKMIDLESLPLLWVLKHRGKPYFDKIKNAHSVSIQVKQTKGVLVRGITTNVDAALGPVKQAIKKVESSLVTETLCINFASDLLKRNDERYAKKIQREHAVWTEHAGHTGIGGEMLVSVPVTNGKRLDLWRGSIVSQEVEVIVNAANGELNNAGGIAKVIADAAGATFAQECKHSISQYGKIPIGEVRSTSAGALRYKAVIHAVGPHYVDGKRGEEEDLRKVVTGVLREAARLGASSVALPPISTGIFRFPIALAAEIITVVCINFLNGEGAASCLNQVRIVEVDENKCEVLQNMLERSAQALHSNDGSVSAGMLELQGEEEEEEVEFWQWSWQADDKQFIPYDPNENSQIENAFQMAKRGELRGDATITVTGDRNEIRNGRRYSISFSEMVQRNIQTKFPRKIQREVVKQMIKKARKLGAIANGSGVKVQYGSRTKNAPVTLQGLPADVKAAGEAIRQLVCDNEMTQPLALDQRLSAIHLKELESIADVHRVAAQLLPDGRGYELKGLSEQLGHARSAMLEYLQNNVSRRERVEYPKQWEPFSNEDSNCEVKQLQEGTPEFQEVAAMVRNTIPTAVIGRIERLQNKWLWERYCQERARVARKNEVEDVASVERWLFHGTRNTQPEVIYNGQDGFDSRCSREGMWGIGTYFAVNASYSTNYAHPTTDGWKQFFLVRMIAGDVFFCDSDKKLRKPPVKSESKAKMGFASEHYDSVGGHTGGSEVFIVYENGRAYPFYLITFRNE